jgi:predicted RND superfamily exporter protein
MLAWLVTILFIPAYITLMGEDDLEKMKTFGDAGNSLLSRYLKSMGGFTLRRYGSILAFTAAALMVAGWGISRIEINDNPVKWFKKDHEIRVADRVLNSHFGGTYEAYLVLEGAAGPSDPAAEAEAVNSALAEVLSGTPLLSMAEEMVEGAGKAGETIPLFYASLTERIETAMDDAPDDEYFLWEDAISAMEAVRNRGEIFKRPDLLNYIAALQADMAGDASVGKSNSVADLVKKVHMELLEGDPSAFRIPDTVAAVAQTLISFQNSHKPDDLYHLVTPDYSGANLWVQLREGDNSVMEATVKRVETFMAKNPPPVPITANWAGLTYINVVWQEKMVTGMLKSFMSSFVVVFLMMALLFRSPLWGLVAMVPLSVTIAVIYGIIGIVGKDYDMPVAVLSSLTLGLAVDFAIHFLERSRSAHRRWGSWREAVTEMFEEPARAISRNVIVVAVGFTPLLLAPLIPYRTVGVFLASIMAVSGIATMVLLPAIIAPLEGVLFGKEKGAAPASVEETI